MSKQIIKHGAEIEFATPADIHKALDPLNHILDALGRNARFNRALLQFNTGATGLLWNASEGPQDGFMWAVMLAAVDIGNAAGTWRLYFNNVSPASAITNINTGPTVATFSKAQCILKGNDKLIVAADAVASAVNYVASVRLDVIEVPIQHEAQLLL